MSIVSSTGNAALTILTSSNLDTLASNGSYNLWAKDISISKTFFKISS